MQDLVDVRNSMVDFICKTCGRKQFFSTYMYRIVRIVLCIISPPLFSSKFLYRYRTFSNLHYKPIPPVQS